MWASAAGSTFTSTGTLLAWYYTEQCSGPVNSKSPLEFVSEGVGADLQTTTSSVSRQPWRVSLGWYLEICLVRP